MISEMKKILFSLCLLAGFSAEVVAQGDSTLKKKDRKKDVLLQTSMGDIVIRLSDSTPLHRDNFLKLVREHYYDSLLWHRVIAGFVIQSGAADTRYAKKGDIIGPVKTPFGYHIIKIDDVQ